jgi:hypothetical protein
MEKSRCFINTVGDYHLFQPGIAGALGREAQQPRCGGKEATRFGHFSLTKTTHLFNKMPKRASCQYLDCTNIYIVIKTLLLKTKKHNDQVQVAIIST